MIDVNQAVKLASDYLRSLYSGEASDIRLEEVVSPKEAPPRWRVTLSFARFPDREYKEFEIDADTGAVNAMRMVKV